ncbi:MAG: Mobile element protein, partial [uncultured Microvirga sp.]
NRHGRFRDSDLLRRLFETVLARCIAEGLVGGEGFAVDGSLIKADASRQKGVEGTGGLPPETVSRAAREYLAVLDDAAFGAATPVVPKFVSPADPASRWTGADGGLAYFAYCTNYLIDLDHAVIVDVEPSTVRQAEVAAAKTMIERTRERFDLWPERLAADTGYGSAAMLGWLVHEQGIEPHIPVFDKSGRKDGTFSRAAFAYDHDSDTYRCPGGKILMLYRRAFATPRIDLPPDDTIRYRPSKADCDACGLKPRCCPNTPARKVTRSIHEGARDMARDIAKTDAYLTSRRERKKGGDALRPPQTHPEPRPAAPERSQRRPRRVPPRRHRPEPQEARQADPDAHASPGVRLRAAHLQDHGRRGSAAQNRVLQRNRRKADFRQAPTNLGLRRAARCLARIWQPSPELDYAFASSGEGQ